MAYQYDAFFSYKRNRETDEWHKKVKEKLEYWLALELNQQQANIFFDTEDIITGNRWKQQLEDALKTSRCIICFWSPVYFQSKWCVSEWATFEKRGQELGLDLVVPAIFHKGNNLPEKAKNREVENFSPYTSTMPRFWETELAVDFEQKCLKPFAQALAKHIRLAPDFDADFPIIEAGDEFSLTEQTIEQISHG